MSSELRRLRTSRALSQAALAERVGLSRQGYAAIESGSARPSVDVALRLAGVLETSVEALFQPAATSDHVVVTDLAGGGLTAWPAPVRVAEVGGRALGFPTRRTGGAGLGPADGLAVPADDGRVRVTLFASRPRPVDLVVVGCDPAFALVADALRRERGIEVLWIQAGSRAALDALARGEAHVAGVHLHDPQTGAYNTPWVDQLLPGASLIHFATWEQALLVAAGNPLGIADAADLTRDGVRLVNRESGSGSRSLLDAWIADAGVSGGAISGYESTHATGHVEVAAAVAAGTADAGVAIRAAGIRFGLDARVLATEPYDFVVPAAALDLPAVRALLDVLRGPALQRQVDALGGYDVATMGKPA